VKRMRTPAIAATVLMRLEELSDMVCWC